MAIGIHDRILLMKEQATKQEKVIIKFIQEHSNEELIYLTITEFAEQAQVAEATLLRFCRKLGLKGYSEFRLVLLQENYDKGKHEEDFAYTICENMNNAINSTYKLLDYDQLNKVVDLILGARHVYTMGSGNSGVAAREMRNKFMRIGIHMDHITDTHLQLITVSTLSADDVVVLFSVSGSTKDMLQCASLARENGVKVVVVTNYLKSPLAGYADACLFIVVKDAPLDGGSLVAKVSQLYIIDVICSAVILRLGDEADRNLEKTAMSVIDKSM